MKSSELRSMLIESIEQVQAGKMSPSDGRNIVGMANQVNLSVQTELKKTKLDLDMGNKVQRLGDMDIT